MDLKQLIGGHLESLEGKEIKSFILFTSNDAGNGVNALSCSVAGSEGNLKLMLCAALEKDPVRNLFEECYSYVLAKRANMGKPLNDFNNN